MCNTKTVKSIELESVNQALLSGELSADRAAAMANEILLAFRKRNSPIVAAYLPKNEVIARRFIEDRAAIEHNCVVNRK